MSVSIHKTKVTEKSKHLRKSGSDFSIENLNFKSLTNIKYTSMIPKKGESTTNFSCK